MIGRCISRFRHLFAAGTLTVTVLTAGFVTHPLSAVAAALDVHGVTHAVMFQSGGEQTEHVTTAPTVGAFLKERGIAPGDRDYIHPSTDTPLVDNLVIDYAPAIPVKLVTAKGAHVITTTATDVGSLLEEQGIQLGAHDVVRPSLSDPLVAHSTVRIMRVVQWVSSQKQRVSERTVREIDFSLPPGQTRVLEAGSAGVSLTMVDYTQTDGTLHKRILTRRVVRKPQTRIIAEGVGTGAAIADFARRGLQKTSYIASQAIDMVATAYTAECFGCTGFTAGGYHAGHGIVAVDPRIIPLGTRLYIPGYGFAIAGDTGGAISGNRIDLGFDSLADALGFGRRAVKVYTLK
ncbi:MAG: ubiquitin-like domain-containing protein [Candidatus Baltobacteraceae bacterium]